MSVRLRTDSCRYQPPHLEVAFCTDLRMHLIFIYYCVIILTIRTTIRIQSLEKGRKGMEENEF